MTPEQRDGATAWLDLLYSDAPADEWLTLFAVRRNAADSERPTIKWATVADRATLVDSAATLPDHNVWFGVSTRNQMTTGRGTRADCATMPALWLDIDFHDNQAHKLDPTKATNPTPEQASELIAAFPLPPSATVNTGYGSHCYWLFTEPQAAANVAALSLAWHQTWELRFRNAGVNLDATYNVDRLLRLPGTANVKVDGRAPEVVAHWAQEPPTYSADEIEPFLLEQTADVGRMTEQRKHFGDSAGNRFNDDNEPGAILLRNGWTPMPDHAPPGQTHWKRPGKETAGKSATTFPDGSVNVWSTASNLESNRWFDAFGLAAFLEHGGDFKATRAHIVQSETDDWLRSAAPGETPTGQAATPIAPSEPEPEGDGIKPLIIRRLPSKFPHEVLPGAAAQYVAALADTLQTPLAVPGQAAIACLSSAANETGANVTIGGSWVEPCNLYTLLVMVSGGGKSPVYNRLLKGFVNIAKTAEGNSAVARAETQSRVRILDAALKIEESRAAKAKDPDIVAEAIDAATRIITERSQIVVPEEREFFQDDFTPAAMVSALAGNQGRLTAISPEGDLLDDFDRFREKGKAPALKPLLLAWDGATIKVKRIADGRSAKVDNARAVICLGMQPMVAHRIFGSKELSGRGLLQRFMPAEPHYVAGFADRTDLRQVPDHLADKWQTMLEGIARGKHSEFEFSPEATSTFVNWHQSLEIQCRPGGALDRLASHVPKVVSSVARASLVFHLAAHHDGDAPRRIASSTVQSAAKLGDYWLENIVNLSGSSNDDTSDLAAEIVRWWCRPKRDRSDRTIETLTVRDIIRSGPRTGGRSHPADAVEAAVHELVAAGWLTAAEVNPKGVTKWRLVCTDPERLIATENGDTRPTRHPRDTNHSKRSAATYSVEPSRQSRVALKTKIKTSSSSSLFHKGWGPI